MGWNVYEDSFMKETGYLIIRPGDQKTYRRHTSNQQGGTDGGHLQTIINNHVQVRQRKFSADLQVKNSQDPRLLGRQSQLPGQSTYCTVYDGCENCLAYKIAKRD